jgi:anti-sigma B factor antagonist
MDIRMEKKKGVCRMKLAGEMTIYHAANLKGPMVEALEQCKDLEINLAGVSEMDTAGFQLLLLAKREAARRDKPLHLVDHSQATLEMLDLFGMAGYFGDPVILKREQ